MRFQRKLYFLIPIVAITIALDQVTKLIAVQMLKYHPPIIYWGDLFRFQYAENTGAMLGFGSDWPPELRFWALTVLVGLFLAALVGYVLFAPDLNRLKIIALSLICGGGISNFIDRVVNNGHVVDFMNMGIGDTLRTGIFNVADMFIMTGMGLLIFFGGLFEKQPKESPSAESSGQADDPPPGQ